MPVSYQWQQRIDRWKNAMSKFFGGERQQSAAPEALPGLRLAGRHLCHPLPSVRSQFAILARCSEQRSVRLFRRSSPGDDRNSNREYL